MAAFAKIALVLSFAPASGRKFHADNAFLEMQEAGTHCDPGHFVSEELCRQVAQQKGEDFSTVNWLDDPFGCFFNGDDFWFKSASAAHATDEYSAPICTRCSTAKNATACASRSCTWRNGICSGRSLCLCGDMFRLSLQRCSDGPDACSDAPSAAGLEFPLLKKQEFGTHCDPGHFVPEELCRQVAQQQGKDFRTGDWLGFPFGCFLDWGDRTSFNSASAANDTNRNFAPICTRCSTAGSAAACASSSCTWRNGVCSGKPVCVCQDSTMEVGTIASGDCSTDGDSADQ